MPRQYYIYILTNKSHTVLYTGITNDIYRRIYEHKHKLIKGFSSKYNVTKLVYYEVFDSAESAIIREKQIKSGSRQKKINLIMNINPMFIDLYDKL